MNRVGQNSRRNVQCKYDHMSINQVITNVLDEYKNKYHGLKLDELLVYIDTNNIINSGSYITCKYIEITLSYHIKIDCYDLIKEEDLIAFREEYNNFCTKITCSNIYFNKNPTYKTLSNYNNTKDIWYNYTLTPSYFNGNTYYKCTQVIYDRNYLISSIDDIKMKYSDALTDGIEPSTLINLLDSTIPVKIVKLVPKIDMEAKLNLVSDALEKDEMKKIMDLHKVIKTSYLNTPLIAIVKDYLGNVSENVQLHLQKEIREIIEAMTGEKYDLNAYIHNL